MEIEEMIEEMEKLKQLIPQKEAGYDNGKFWTPPVPPNYKMLYRIGKNRAYKAFLQYKSEVDKYIAGDWITYEKYIAW